MGIIVMSRSPVNENTYLYTAYQRFINKEENHKNEIENEKRSLLGALQDHVKKHKVAINSLSECKLTILNKCIKVLENSDKNNYDALQSEINNQKKFVPENRYTKSTGFFSRVSKTAALVDKTTQLLNKMSISSCDEPFITKK